MKYKWWTYAEIDRCKQLYKEGKTIVEIAEALDRSVLSITNLLVTERVIDNPNIQFVKQTKVVDQNLVKQLREEYPHGTRIILERMKDQQAPPVGTYGTVNHVDDIGTIHTHWDNGSNLGVVYDEDRCRKADT